MNAVGRVFLAITVVMLVVVCAGCGETSKAEYTRNMQSALKPLQQQFKTLRTPNSRTMKAAGLKMQDVADTIEDIDAPSEVQGLHTRMVRDLRSLGELIVKLSPEMDKLNKDPSAFNQVQADLPGITREFEKKSADLDVVMKSYTKHGYSFAKASGISS